MRNLPSLNWILFLAVLVASLTTKANGLPTLKPENLPYTFDITHTGAYLDVDGNGVSDYHIYYNPGSSPSCWISSYGTVTSPSESSSLKVTSLPVNEVLLEDHNYTSFLPYGASIGLATPTGPGSSWFWDGCIFSYYQGDNAPLGSSSYDGSTSGYIGLQFEINGSDHYGWLYTTINDGGSSVTIGPIGYSTSPGSPVLAGGSAVPIPIIASIFGFGLIGGGLYLRRRKKK